jgi:hypothetical protein
MVRPVLADTNFPVAELRPMSLFEFFWLRAPDRLVVVRPDFDGAPFDAPDLRALVPVLFATVNLRPMAKINTTGSH